MTTHFSGLTNSVWPSCGEIEAAANRMTASATLDDREHVNAEREQAGDRKADRHVVVDAEHVRPEALVDLAPVRVRHRRSGRQD